MPPRNPIPIIESFNIPALGWRFVDLRTVNGKQELDAKGAWVREARTWLATQGVAVEEIICGLDASKELTRVADLFDAARELNPDLTWREFEDSGGTVTDERMSDPRKQTIFLGIRIPRGPWIGALSLANIDVESRSPTDVEIATTMFAGTPNGEGMSIPETWRIIYRFIMRRGLTLRNGKNLHVMQYNFMSGPEIRARHADHPELNEWLGMMREDFDTRGDRDNRTEAVRFRRRPHAR